MSQEQELIEHIAKQWDGCTYPATGYDIGIGAAIREAAKSFLAVAALASPPEGGVVPVGLSAQIMNIQVPDKVKAELEGAPKGFYMLGHRDARHAAAELADAATSPPAAASEAVAWQPIETAPKDGTEVLAWRDDCGAFIASFRSVSSMPLTQEETDSLDEETLFQEDWFTQWPAAERLEGNEVPIHWMPLPPAPLSGATHV